MLVILGGTCFIGRHLVRAAKEKTEEYPGETVPTIVINRGRPYWVSMEQSDEQYKPIYRIIGDRSDPTSMRAAIVRVREILSSKYNSPCTVTICDFSCDDENDMDVVWDAIQNNIISSSVQYPPVVSKLQYILVSSDSVYESKYVSIGVSEEHGVLCPRNTIGYSGEKRRCELALERVLLSFASTGAVRCVCLRLPDVLGEFDRSGRFWAPLLWAQSDIPLIMSEKMTRSRQLCSFVYAGDVARVVLKLHRCLLISAQVPQSPSVNYYNIACVERVTISDFLQIVISSAEKELKKPIKRITINTCHIPYDSSSPSSSDDTEYDSENVENFSCDFYPSVTCGPLNISKIQQELQFTPISLTEAIDRSVHFFCHSCNHKNSQFNKIKNDNNNTPKSSSEYRCALKKLPIFVRTVVQHTVK